MINQFFVHRREKQLEIFHFYCLNKGLWMKSLFSLKVAKFQRLKTNLLTVGAIGYFAILYFTQRRKVVDGPFFNRIFKKEICKSHERVSSKGMGEAHVLKNIMNWQPCMGVIGLAVLYVVW